MKRMKNKIKEAGLVLRTLFDKLQNFISDGMSTKEIDEYAEKLLKIYGGVSAASEVSFPGHVFISVNKEVLGGIPGDYILQPGDLVSLDMTMIYDGVYVDKAVTFVMEPVNYICNYLVYSGKTCLQNASGRLKKGALIRSIGASIETTAHRQGLQPGKEFYGHGVGDAMHTQPLIPNFDNGDMEKLTEGQLLTIEPILFYGYYDLSSKNTFTTVGTVLSSHFEDTFLITDSGMEVIT